MTPIPYITPELVEYLEKLYRDQCPGLKTPDREIWYRAGQVDVVRHIRAVFDKQNENVLGDDINVHINS